MTATAASAPSPQVNNGFRWTQLIVGIICMAMMANLQYGWTFFVPDIQKTLAVPSDTLQEFLPDVDPAMPTELWSPDEEG